jgi:predicted XRE-type DNA-binding protein
MEDKPINWLGTARDDVCSFPEDARRKVGFQKGNSNIFEDLGFEKDEATNLKIRADLMLDLRKFIQSKNWTQAEAAIFFGETQPRISNLMNGDIERFAFA